MVEGRAARAARRRWRRIRAGTWRVTDPIPLTPLGLLVVVGSALCWLYMGGERLDQVLTVVAQVGVGLVLLSVLSVVVAALRF